jgi:hypothetical protein
MIDQHWRIAAIVALGVVVGGLMLLALALLLTVHPLSNPFVQLGTTVGTSTDGPPATGVPIPAQNVGSPATGVPISQPNP